MAMGTEALARSRERALRKAAETITEDVFGRTRATTTTIERVEAVIHTFISEELVAVKSMELKPAPTLHHLFTKWIR